MSLWLPRGYIGIPHTISNPSLSVCANDVPARQGTTECVTYMLSPMLYNTLVNVTVPRINKFYLYRPSGAIR